MEWIAMGRILFDDNEYKTFQVKIKDIPDVYRGESNEVSVENYIQGIHENIKEFIVDDIYLHSESTK